MSQWWPSNDPNLRSMREEVEPLATIDAQEQRIENLRRLLARAYSERNKWCALLAAIADAAEEVSG